MTANTVHKPEVHWDRSEFKKLKATWSAERIAEDKTRLQEIFKLAADSPLLAQALEWANQHGIKFFVDRTVVNMGAYYTLGTGIVGIKELELSSPTAAVAAIVHEVRHAWQDYHGFRENNSPNFSDSFIVTALIEADAAAFGERAKDEYRATQLKKKHRAVPAALRSSLTNESADLKEKFLSWFSSPETTQFYGMLGSDYYVKWIYPAINPQTEKSCQLDPKEDGSKNTGPEFVSYLPMPTTGFDITSPQSFLQLGRSFHSTAHYLAGLQPDILPKKILRPSLANTFWGAANDDQKKLTTEIRKAYLRKKLAAKLAQKIPQ